MTASRLPGALWKDAFVHEDEAYTSVIVPSLTLEPRDLARHPHALFREETLLFLLTRLRNPRARVVFVTSQPIPPVVLEYYLQFLAGIPASHARARLSLLAAYDASARPLTEKILERPRLLERIRAAIPDASRAYLRVLRATAQDRQLAERLGIALDAAGPGLESACSKSNAADVFRAAGIAVPARCANLRTAADLLEALRSLRRMRPGLSRALLRLDTTFSGDGHAVFRYSETNSDEALRRGMDQLTLGHAAETTQSHLERFARIGGVVEELVEGQATATAQMRVDPSGEAILISTHDELRGGPSGLSSQGCRFPADERYRLALQEAGLRVARVLADRGVRSRLSVEFLVSPERGSHGWRLLGSEISLGMGGSTHPLLAVRFLCGGRMEPATGLFRSPSGRPKFYRASDHLVSDVYRRLVPEDLIEILTLQELNFSAQTESGALAYMLGALSEFGRVGLLAVGNSSDEAEDTFERTIRVLDEQAVAQIGT